MPTGGAWVDYSGFHDHNGSWAVNNNLASPSAGRFVANFDSGNCGNWSETSYMSGGFSYDALGEIVIPSAVQQTQCKTTHVLACCSTPYKEKFAGFTTATMTGAVGGRALMHFACGSQFPGSHLCHAAEYSRAASTLSPPSGGAWIDYSGYQDSNGSWKGARHIAQKLGLQLSVTFRWREKEGAAFPSVTGRLSIAAA